MANNVVRNRLKKKITSVSLDRDELRKLLDLLQEQSYNANDIEIEKFEKQNLENIEVIKSNLNACAILKLTVKGNNSEELFGTIQDVFSSTSFPEHVTSVYVNTELNYDSLYKHHPENSFWLLLDFTAPGLWDLSLQPEYPTPNQSMLEVEGSNALWVNGVFSRINAFLDLRPSKYSKIHRGSFYNFIVWFLGIPFAFSICYSFLGFKLSLTETYPFLGYIAVTYLFLLCLLLLRLTFHYFRWVYPMVEYKHKNSGSFKHQAALLSISLGILGKLLYDIVKFLAFKNQ